MPSKICGRCSNADTSYGESHFFGCKVHKGRAVTYITSACEDFEPDKVFKFMEIMRIEDRENIRRGN